MITKAEYKKTLIRMWDSVRDGDGNNMGKPNCGGVSCDRCPLYNNGDDVCGAHASYRAYDAISIVEKWGKEHPIKTNREVFTEAMKEKFGDILNVNVLKALLEERGCELVNRECHGSCNTCALSNFWDKEYKGVSHE